MAETIEIRVPNIGDFKDIPVIDVLVKPGDRVEAESPLVTLESEKAAMDVPSPQAGTVREVSVQVGARVSEGSALLVLETRDAAPAAPAASAAPSGDPPSALPAGASAIAANGLPPAAAHEAAPAEVAGPAPAQAPSPHALHASPAVRRFARELGVAIESVAASGPHGRITREDVQAHVKAALATHASGALGFAGLPPWPKQDFASYGPVEVVPLSRIRRFSGPNLHRNWLSIPHVTNFDEADVTELEAFRTQLNAEQAAAEPLVRFTLLPFAIVAVVAALRAFPDLNASLDGEQLVRKRYYHIGFAAETSEGLVVPVIRDADRKGLRALATEAAALARKARDGKLALAEMGGASFTISSLGGIGGTGFTPIVNAPEVAILGLSRALLRPRWNGSAFEPRLMLPLSLSYDHRAIDGALAARFLARLSSLLADLRRSLV
ncbi:MAG: 2-oxo acid dehydrogenase subunit E2 [Vulcanimicrobiaceae bacterium]